MPDREIQFGDVEQTHHDQRLPPSHNKQYAVATCGNPVAGDLPVFVELDAMRDMETHAMSDTRVELGGVLLGGQYEDEEGRPFVVVADSLRARHYEATKGSFKFTHDTWSEITRQRDEFPDDLHMVGWYHTHPDWGVFLSGMDLFICENFFSRELDVALVIDPCRGHRGWFQWTGQADDRIRQTGGFHVFASRHRRMELELFTAHLENQAMTTSDPRLGGYPAGGAPYPWPVTGASDPRQAWFGLAVIGMLAMQFFLLVFLAWRVLVPGDEAVALGKGPDGRSASEIEKRENALGELEAKSQEVEAQLQVLDRVVEQLGSGTPDGLVDLLKEKVQENKILKDDARVYRDLENRVNRENEALSRALSAANADGKRLAEQIGELETTAADQRRLEKQYEREITALNRTLESYEDPDDDTSLAATFGQPRLWIWAGCGAIVGALIVIGVLVFYPRSRADWEMDEDLAADTEKEMGRDMEDDAKDPPLSTNNDSETSGPSSA